MIVSILLHELSHAVIATGYGGFVAEIGIRKIKYGFKYYTRVFWGNVPINNKICFLLGGIAMNMWLSSFGCFIVYRYKLVCGFFCLYYKCFTGNAEYYTTKKVEFGWVSNSCSITEI